MTRAGAVAPIILLAALTGCSLLPDDDPAQAVSSPVPVTSAAAKASSPAPMTHRQLCDWAADLAGRFDKAKDFDEMATPWERLAAEARVAGQAELRSIAVEVSTAIRAFEFDRVSAVFKERLPAECLPNG